MELRDIEYFAVIAEHGHLGRAADALGLSQPALSKSLRRLEQALQVKLVKRTPKGVEWTAEGSVLLLRVRELRLSLQGVAREIADVSQGRVGHLRIGVSAAISEQLLSVAFANAAQGRAENKADRVRLGQRLDGSGFMQWRTGFDHSLFARYAAGRSCL
jgi:DNA-binding transcriptional LysR family regulator